MALHCHRSGSRMNSPSSGEVYLHHCWLLEVSLFDTRRSRYLVWCRITCTNCTELSKIVMSRLRGRHIFYNVSLTFIQCAINMLWWTWSYLQSNFTWTTGILNATFMNKILQNFIFALTCALIWIIAGNKKAKVFPLPVALKIYLYLRKELI